MKPFKSIMSMTLMFAAVMYVGADFAFADDRDAMRMDTVPGPAYTTVDGMVTKIEGPVYTIQTESTVRSPCSSPQDLRAGLRRDRPAEQLSASYRG